MAAWKGHFDGKGSPTLPISVEVPSLALLKFEAIVDTGFTGFLSLPLAVLYFFKDHIEGLQNVTFADGTNSKLLEVIATVVIEDERIAGRAIIEPGGHEAIIGTEFLRTSNRGLIVFPGKNEILLPKDVI